jgi:hypothetical protein
MRTDAGTPHDASRRRRGPDRTPVVDVPLTWARPAAPATARLRVAWVLFATFGLLTLLAVALADPQGGVTAAARVAVPLYALTIGALVWAGVETRGAARPAVVAVRRPSSR